MRVKREVFDAQAGLLFWRRLSRGKSHQASLLVRIVGLREDLHGDYHWYLTNLTADQLPATDVGKIHAAGWTIELLLRGLKHCYHLESMPSAKPHIVEALLCATVLTLLAGRALLVAACRWADLYPLVASGLGNEKLSSFGTRSMVAVPLGVPHPVPLKQPPILFIQRYSGGATIDGTIRFCSASPVKIL